MSRFRVVVSEAMALARRQLSTTFAATMTVLIGMFMLGLVVGLGSWALSLSDHYKKQLLVNVYFCTDAPLRQRGERRRRSTRRAHVARRRSRR